MVQVIDYLLAVKCIKLQEMPFYVTHNTLYVQKGVKILLNSSFGGIDDEE